MPFKPEKLQFANCGDGALVKAFEAGVDEIFRDIHNRPKVEDKRTLALTVEITPQEGGYCNIVVGHKVGIPMLKHASMGKIEPGEIQQLVDAQQELNVAPVTNIGAGKEKKC